MAKHKDLQPWLDYFEMLHSYESKGFLEVPADKHEAYVTHPALLTLAGCDIKDGGYDTLKVLQSVKDTVLHLRTYAAFISQEGEEYLKQPFAVHVVKDTEPHDLLSTVVVTVRRRWNHLWMTGDEFDVINYQ